ncbi:histidinol-phosphate aminotransferase [Carnobacterium iners]|uniref:Histidinol-phosphate aminotransferase n=1 Tax=Carnobacterium iners TaxID=1073423 RepID=A0A1X7MXI9_9LACT|nr:histidinol-phosphate transaminase [Carnobacterium iners]SEK17777.1 histidinol-phosphate aminotransferase [Carnobacterium iners]SMH29169.1 histidinol-phosphate aminotransferase [Carnobacterium iners]
MEKYVREEIKKLNAYEVLNKDFTIKLDANEGVEWIKGLNRYPLDKSDTLRGELAKKLGKDKDEIVLGNGSSELIELAMKAYLEAGKTVVSFSPTFSMYQIFTIIHKGNYEEYPLDDKKKLNIEGFVEFIQEKKAKLVIISNPNNPTGLFIPREEIKKILTSVDAMVILDEAYIEFTNEPKTDFTKEFKNMLVLRTFSKAMGLAGIRLGYMIADKENIGYINRVRSPYNVNALTQEMGLKVLNDQEITNKNIEMIKKEREKMRLFLQGKDLNPFPSEANFLFFQAPKAVFDALENKAVLIRDFSGKLEGYYRLTIGTPQENESVRKIIKEVQHATS